MHDYSKRVFEFSNNPNLKNNHPTKLWLASCTSHTMHRFVKALRVKVNIEEKEHREFAVNCFALLLNCTLLEVSSALFSFICFCFNSPKDDMQCENARRKLQEMIEERPTTREETSKIIFRVKTNNFNNDKENETADEYEEDPIVSSLADQFVCLSSSKKKKLTIKASSPFIEHYLQIQQDAEAKFNLIR